MPAAERWPALPFFLFACVVWAGGVGVQRLRDAQPEATLAPWQRRFTSLTPEEQRTFRSIREGLFELEGVRAETGVWPAPAEVPPDVPAFGTPSLHWERRTQSLTTSYVTTSVDGTDRRWLVLYLEPDERALKEVAPPEDEEHHTLPSGQALHVTVWTQRSAEPLPAGVLAFPATEGWVQVLGR